jgi:hypothetical protein
MAPKLLNASLHDIGIRADPVAERLVVPSSGLASPGAWHLYMSSP